MRILNGAHAALVAVVLAEQLDDAVGHALQRGLRVVDHHVGVTDWADGGGVLFGNWCGHDLSPYWIGWSGLN